MSDWQKQNLVGLIAVGLLFGGLLWTMVWMFLDWSTSI